MDEQSTNNSRIIKNTLLLYMRMLFAMGISLYTSRVVLNALGVDDYGVYNVVGGVVIMLGFLQSSMSSATSRFIAFALGTNSNRLVKKTFGTTLLLHIGLALLLLILAETIGLWFLNSQLNIPIKSMVSANWIYQFAIFTTIATILQVPFNAAIIAHERMHVFAVIEIINVLLKLIATVLLLAIAIEARLIMYGGFLFIASIIVSALYVIYSRRSFAACQTKPLWNKTLLKDMTSFFKWDLLGNLSMVVRGQGVNIILNIFFSVTVNAASAIATQIQSAATAFSGNFLIAIKPQIFKSYAQNDIKTFMNLMVQGSKFSFYLFSIIATPLIVNMSYVLKIWLINPPEYVVPFAQLMLATQMIAITSQPVIGAIHATGKVKRLSLLNGIINLSILPICYFTFKMHHSEPYWAYIINLGLSAIAVINNLYTLKRLVHYSIGAYAKKVFIPCYLSQMLMIGILIIAGSYISHDLSKLLVTSLLTVLIYPLLMYISLSQAERQLVTNKFIDIKSLFKNI